MNALQVIEMIAGYDANGQAIAEQLRVKVDENNQCELTKSPAFIKGIASGDVIRLVEQDSRHFEIVKRSGNLCIRVLAKGNIETLADRLTPKLEKLGGQLDIESPRMLVYSIHVSCGFKNIENILNAGVDENSTWLYGNVYDPEDGQTPLNWWQEILAEK